MTNAISFFLFSFSRLSFSSEKHLRQFFDSVVLVHYSVEEKMWNVLKSQWLTVLLIPFCLAQISDCSLFRWHNCQLMDATFIMKKNLICYFAKEENKNRTKSKPLTTVTDTVLCSTKLQLIIITISFTLKVHTRHNSNALCKIVSFS